MGSTSIFFPFFPYEGLHLGVTRRRGSSVGSTGVLRVVAGEGKGAWHQLLPAPLGTRSKGAAVQT